MKKYVVFCVLVLSIASIVSANAKSGAQSPKCNDKKYIKILKDGLNEKVNSICGYKTNKEECLSGYSEGVGDSDNSIIHLNNQFDIAKIETIALEKDKTLVCKISIGLEAGGLCEGYQPFMEYPYVINKYNAKESDFTIYNGTYIERTPEFPPGFDFDRDCGYEE